jgi:hypothetical protein
VLICLVFISQSFWFLLFIIDSLCNNYNVYCFGGMSFWLWPVFQIHEVCIFMLMQYLLFDTETLRQLLEACKLSAITWIFDYI